MNLPEPKVKRCGCGVPMHRRQDEPPEAWDDRILCPRCADEEILGPGKHRHAIVGCEKAVTGQNRATDPLERR